MSRNLSTRRRLRIGTAAAAVAFFVLVTFALPLHSAMAACGMSCCHGSAAGSMSMGTGCCADQCEMSESATTPERPDAVITSAKTDLAKLRAVATRTLPVMSAGSHDAVTATDAVPRAPQDPLYLRNSVLII